MCLTNNNLQLFYLNESAITNRTFKVVTAFRKKMSRFILKE